VLISASLFVALGDMKTATVRTTQPLPTIVVGGTTFTYTQWNSSTPDSFTISGVKFSLWTNTSVTFSGGSCYGAGGYGGYVITFPGGSTETMTTCTIGINPPSTVIRLSSHVDPQAGLLIYPSTGAVYFLVSASSASPATNAPTMLVNGSLYYADNITSDITIGFPGYSYFNNASVTFLGVKFETYCPLSYEGCPAPPGTTRTITYTTMSLGVVGLNMTFLDKSTEYISALIGDDDYIFAFTHHTDPQAGVLIIYDGGFKAYLLVSQVART